MYSYVIAYEHMITNKLRYYYHIYIHTCMCVCVCICIYMYTCIYYT